MTLQLIIASFFYITSDPFFWASMAFTTIIGIFIGSVVYDGDLEQIKKALVLLSSYCMMLLIVTSTRVIPQVSQSLDTVPERPLAGIVTIVVVTVFYLLGMLLGVILTRKAHGRLY